MTCVHQALVCTDCGTPITDTVPKDMLLNLERERRTERDKANARMRQARQLIENAPGAEDILKVVVAWEERFASQHRAHRRASSPGSKSVRRAQGWGFTADELILSFDGALRDDWVMGRHPKTAGKRARLTALVSLLSDPDKISERIQLALKPMELVAPETVDKESVLSRKLQAANEKVRALEQLRAQDAEVIRELGGKAGLYQVLMQRMAEELADVQQAQATMGMAA